MKPLPLTPRLILKLILILISSFLLVSCLTPSEKDSLQYNYKQGFAELSLLFEEQRYPLEEYQKTERPFTFTFHNLAAYDLNQLEVEPTGFDRRYVEIISQEEGSELLEGRSLFNPAGEKKDYTFFLRLKELPPGADYLQQNYRLHVSYSSKIEFSSDLCLNFNSYQTYTSGCEIKPHQSFRGQGGPLAVKSMEQITRAGYQGTAPEIELRLKIKNEGTGKVKKLSLGQARLGNEPINCYFRDSENGNSRSILLEDKKQETELLCIQKLKERVSYSSVLFLELFYDYQLSIKKSLQIKR